MRRLDAFFAWWFGELAALVPAPVRRTFSRDSKKLVLEFTGKEIVVGLESGNSVREIGRLDASDADPWTLGKTVPRLFRKARKGGVDVAIRLPANQVLRKTVRLPLAAEDNLREVISFEMDRQTPFEASEVYYDYRMGARDTDAQFVEVELVVAPRRIVDAAVEKVAGWGLQPVIVDIAGDGSSPDNTLNLIRQERNRNTAGPGGVLMILLTALAVILFAAAAYVPIDQQRRVAESLHDRVVEARAEAASADRLREEIERITKDARFLVDKKRHSPAAIRIVDELTRILPDGSWLLQLQVRGSEIVIAGYSATASDLIGLIEQSPLFGNAKFRSIVTQDAKVGLERFNLSADIVWDADQ